MHAGFNDLVIHYEIEGPEGSPFVTLSHSLASSLELWDLQVPVLRDKFRVLRYDTRGHGSSSAPTGPYSVEMLAADLIGLLDRLEIERTHFVGISMGGMIGQVLACRYAERIGRLVLSNTTCRVAPEAAPLWEERIRTAETEGMEALAPDILNRWLSDQFRRNQPELTDMIRHMIVSTPVSGYVGCSQAIGAFDVSSELSKVTAPTLIIAGRMDESTPVSAAMAIQERIEGSELAVIPGALHLSNVETSEFFNQALARFLEQ
ncbi:MAG: 3-oxoadipate enol-lactonase [Deltaproteobacteria bacterium]|jgi:3-oxoadipate enol-lactonase|nr:3-oxoadipate enol-lactonase [Deltaproteobacteria bacterium]